MRLASLFVLWADARDGTRHAIGTLWRADGGFAFAYDRDLTEAFKHGFRLLPEFPRHEDVYRARYLFSTFAQRIPSPARRDYDEILASWGVWGVDDPLEILARSGGIQATDSIELSEHRDVEDPLTEPLEFRVSGGKYFDGGSALSAGDDVGFERRPENPHDENATIILTVSGKEVGWVPRQYSPLFARLLDAGQRIKGTAVRFIDLPGNKGRWVVRAQAVAK